MYSESLREVVYVRDASAPRSASATNTLTHRGLIMDDFPFFVNKQFKNDMICEWQERMHPDFASLLSYAVCAQRCKVHEIEEVDLTSFDLTLLQNPALLQMVLLITYVLTVFKGALLYPKVLCD